MEFSVRDNIEKHRFEIELSNGVAIAEYLLRPGRIIFTHTEVPPEHEGQGIGTALVRAGLAFARERGLKVAPICPFFAEYLREHVEEQDLLDPAWAKRLGLPAS
jgi:uncharacterized protein